MKSRYSLFCSAILLSSFLPATSSFAQSKIKDGSVTGSVTLPSSNAILELESTNKGFLLPRTTLSSTTSFAPLSAHVEGITVYNTATAGDVVPGYYYNDGAKWVRLADAAAADQTKDAWVDDHTNMQVKMGTRSDGTTVLSCTQPSLTVITVYPNPAREQLTIDGLDPGVLYRLSLLADNGRAVLYRIIQQSSRAVLDIGHLPSASYILGVQAEGQENLQYVKVVKL